MCIRDRFRAGSLHQAKVLATAMLVPRAGLWNLRIFMDNRIIFLLILAVCFCGPVQKRFQMCIRDRIMSVRHSDQEEAVDIARRFAAVGYQIFATRGTARTLNKNGVKAYEIRKLEQESPNVLDLVLGHQIDLIIDIPAQGAERSRDGFIIRRNAIETGVNVLTSLDTACLLYTSAARSAWGPPKKAWYPWPMTAPSLTMTAPTRGLGFTRPSPLAARERARPMQVLSVVSHISTPPLCNGKMYKDEIKNALNILSRAGE